MGEVIPREQAEIERLARADGVVKPVEADAERRRADLFDEGHGRLEIVRKARPGIEFEREFHAGVGGPLRRLGQAHRQPAEVLRREWSKRIAGDHEHGDAEVAEDGQPRFKMLPVLEPGLTLAGEQAALKAGRHRGDPVPLEPLLQGRDAVPLQKPLGVPQPEIDRLAVARRIVLENRLERRVERTDCGNGGDHRSLSHRSSTTSASGTRVCTSESRSRRVTVLSDSVWPSIVRHQGVPASSCLA